MKGIRGLCVPIRICWSRRNIMLILIGSKNKINRKEDRKNGKNGFVTFVGKTSRVCTTVVNVGLICAKNAEKSEYLSIDINKLSFIYQLNEIN